MILALIFLFGIIFGSFLNVLILRIPQNMSVSFPASHCPKCKSALKPWHNIPVFSWIFLRGKCGFCALPIPKVYPIIELATGLIFLAVFMKLGFSANVYVSELLMMGVMYSLSFSFLLALSMIDLKFKAVPDSLNLLALTMAVFAAFNMQGFVQNFQLALLFAGGFTLLRFYLSYLLSTLRQQKIKSSWVKKYDVYVYIEAVGEGDIMVAATMGALLGVELGLVAIFLSALLALPASLLTQGESDESKKLPFVPFLALATAIVFFFDSFFIDILKALYA